MACGVRTWVSIDYMRSVEAVITSPICSRGAVGNECPPLPSRSLPTVCGVFDSEPSPLILSRARCGRGILCGLRPLCEENRRPLGNQGAPWRAWRLGATKGSTPTPLCQLHGIARARGSKRRRRRGRRRAGCSRPSGCRGPGVRRPRRAAAARSRAPGAVRRRRSARRWRAARRRC